MATPRRRNLFGCSLLWVCIALLVLPGCWSKKKKKDREKKVVEETKPAKPSAPPVNQACIDMYKEAFKGQAGIKPASVGDVYFKHCKKTMRLDSAKSNDELCKPLVKKVEEKMLFVPPDTDVTPEIVCKTKDQLKADYPEQAAVAEAAGKEVSAADALREELNKKAKAVSGKIGDDIKQSLNQASEDMIASLRPKIEANLADAFGAIDEGKAKVVSGMMDALKLALRGVETKIQQKKDDSIKEILVQETKRAQTKEKKEL
eukprot:TRINITY_DN41754_c0_g1_i1.p1 TRINITY_DN41754_c0_g1~~TRINITY_DN41754_c0_g1_i1.p1  ORF type:complete len:276 (+),score=59.27 TRINITY_DN41754_c0_g1_i1:51-830(+)